MVQLVTIRTTEGGLVVVNVDKIIRIESSGAGSVFHLVDGEIIQAVAALDIVRQLMLARWGLTEFIVE